jgi:antitoxin (DNA-binding transcriptional repressor) of toxin-antitoxin stability system
MKNTKKPVEFPLAVAKAKLSELTSLVDEGTQVVICKYGKPAYTLNSFTVAETVPLQYGAAAQKDSLESETEWLASIRAKVKPDSTNSVAVMRKKNRY